MTRYDLIWHATEDYLAGASGLADLLEVAEEVAWAADDDPLARAFASLVLRAEAEVQRGDSDEAALRREITHVIPAWAAPKSVLTGADSETDITGFAGVGTRHAAASA